MKRRHDLGGPVPPTLQDLSEAGIDLTSILAATVDKPELCSCLLTGSLADGNGTDSSDVDLMLLVPTGVAVIGQSDALSLETTRLSEKLFYVDGLEVNIDIAERSRVATIAGWMLTLAPALYNPRDLKSVPLIDGADLKFLVRLASGRALTNESVADSWRDEFLVEMIATYLTVRHFVEIGEFLEDARSHRDSAPETAKFIANIATEHALLSLLAFLNRPLLSRKWLLIETDKEILKAEGVTRDTLLSAKSLLLDSSLPVAAAIESVTAMREELREVLSSDAEVSTAIAYLSEEISYVENAE